MEINKDYMQNRYTTEERKQFLSIFNQKYIIIYKGYDNYNNLFIYN